MFCVYILTNKTNKVLYTGVTNNLKRRIMEHKSKEVEGFTKKYHVDKLVFYECSDDVKVAIEGEKRIKGWSRQKKIELIKSRNPDFIDLFFEL